MLQVNEPCAEVLTFAEAMALLRLRDPRVLRRLAMSGALPCRKVGRQWRFRRSSLLAWFDRQDECSTKSADRRRQNGSDRRQRSYRLGR